MTDVTVANSEMIPWLGHLCFNHNEEIAETVRDFAQHPTRDSIMWDVAKRCFQGNQRIMEIVQEYILGVSPVYLNIAERVQSRASRALLSWFSDQISSVHSETASCKSGGIVEVRKACLFVASNVALFPHNNVFNTTPVTEVARSALRGINLLHPLNEDDPILQEEIAGEDLLMTPTGHRFSLISLAHFHNNRPYRGTQGEQHGQKFPVNPVTNTFFPWHDVQSILIAAVRSGRVFHELHRGAVVPPGTPGVFPWASLNHFYTWIWTHPDIGADPSIHRQMDVLIYKENQNDHLQKLWGRVYRQIASEGVPGVSASAQEIRSWMHAKKNQPLLQGITFLQLADLHLTSVPEEIGLLTGLKKIDLSRNRLTSLPEDLFQNLGALEELLVFENHLTSLPKGLFSGSSRLQMLHLSNNLLVSLPEGIFHGLNRLQVLSLNDNRLTSLHEGLFQGLDGLETLFLYNNRLASLPEGLFQGLDHLEVIYLSHNRLVSLPERLFSGQSALSRLALNCNQLASLPQNLLRGLTSLIWLHLDHNQLTSLPEGLFDGPTGLELLCLGDNQLVSLPGSLLQRQMELRTLFLNNNQLVSLPEEIFQGLNRLESLHLNDNQMLSLPERLFERLDGLQKLSLFHNPLLISFQDLSANFNNIGFRDLMHAFFSYRCRSPLAQVYQLAAGNRAPEVVREAFAKLDRTIQNAIFQRVCEEAGRSDPGEVLGNMQIFKTALKKYVRGNFDRLLCEQKAHGDHSAQNDEEVSDGILVPGWAEPAAMDNILPLIDGMM